jgi:hypothetical protein
MTTNELENVLRGTRVDDVLLDGFMDQDEVPVRFRALRDSLYFELGSVYLHFKAIDSEGAMSIAIVDAMGEHPALDEDMVHAVSSMREQVLQDADGSNEVKALRLWGPAEVAGELRCRAAQLELGNGQQIFVDPSYHFGMRIGGGEQRETWLASWPGAASEREHVLSLVAP